MKVDRSFVSRIGVDDGSEMVRAIAAIAHNMGMDVVAEGVETVEQLEGCGRSAASTRRDSTSRGRLTSPPPPD